MKDRIKSTKNNKNKDESSIGMVNWRFFLLLLFIFRRRKKPGRDEKYLRQAIIFWVYSPWIKYQIIYTSDFNSNKITNLIHIINTLLKEKPPILHILSFLLLLVLGGLEKTQIVFEFEAPWQDLRQHLLSQRFRAGLKTVIYSGLKTLTLREAANQKKFFL